jgi:hypothetical protein
MIHKLATTGSRSTPCMEGILQPGELIDPEYKSILGKLGWINMISRPDMAFAYSALSRHADTSGERQMAAMANALKYLSKTTGYVLTHKRDGSNQLHKTTVAHSDFRRDTPADEGITASTNSSRGGERQMAGNSIMLDGNPLVWRAYRSNVLEGLPVHGPG